MHISSASACAISFWQDDQPTSVWPSDSAQTWSPPVAQPSSEHVEQPGPSRATQVPKQVPAQAWPDGCSQQRSSVKVAATATAQADRCCTHGGAAEAGGTLRAVHRVLAEVDGAALVRADGDALVIAAAEGVGQHVTAQHALAAVGRGDGGLHLGAAIVLEEGDDDRVLARAQRDDALPTLRPVQAVVVHHNLAVNVQHAAVVGGGGEGVVPLLLRVEVAAPAHDVLVHRVEALDVADKGVVVVEIDVGVVLRVLDGRGPGGKVCAYDTARYIWC